MVATSAFGYGVATISSSGEVLDTWYHTLGLGEPSTAPDLTSFEGKDDIRQISKKAVKVSINLKDAPKDVSDAYLRLHLLSHTLVRPHGLNLDGIFAILPNNVWSSRGVCDLETFASNQGFTSNRDKDGFARPSGNWAHQMALIAMKDDSRPGALIQNSWGPSWIGGPKGEHDIPDGSFWCDAEVLERNILRAGDSWAHSSFDGFPPQKLDLECF